MESRSLDLTVRRIFPLYCYDLLRLLRMLIVFCFVYVRYSFLYVSVMFVLFCLLLRGHFCAFATFHAVGSARCHKRPGGMSWTKGS